MSSQFARHWLAFTLDTDIVSNFSQILAFSHRMCRKIRTKILICNNWDNAYSWLVLFQNYYTRTTECLRNSKFSLPVARICVNIVPGVANQDFVLIFLQPVRRVLQIKILSLFFYSQFDVFLVEPDKLDIKRHLHGIVFIMHHKNIFRCKERQTKEKQTQFCLNLLTSRIRYNVSRWCHLTNPTFLSQLTSVCSQSSSRIISVGIAW